MAQALDDRWYSDWFNDDYLTLYAHRTAGEARSVADLMAARLPEVGGGRTLDLGCGAGRHLPFLGERQPTVGLDLSPWLLSAARKKLPDAPLVRADMRTLPFRDRAFTLVASLFTSFGYFCDDAENRHVLNEISRVVEPGGWLVLDFLNASYTRRTLIPFERTRLGDEWVQQARSVSDDGRFVSKMIHMETSGREFLERVRLFEPWDLMAMLAAAGFEVTELCGDYRGAGWSAASPRAIVIARRRSTVESTIPVQNDGCDRGLAVSR